MTLPEIFAWMNGLGNAAGALAPFLLYLWYSEREERRRAQAERNEIADKTHSLIGEFKQTIETLKAVILPRGVP